MIRVDFYILADANEERRLHYICRLTDKAWRLGHRIWIHAASAAQAEALDERLWTFDPGGFLPHERAGDGDLNTCPVIIGEAPPADAIAGEAIAGEATAVEATAGETTTMEPDGTPGPDLLINDHGDPVDKGLHVARIAEVVNQDPAIRDAGRARYTRYRDAGFELHHHRVD